MAKVRIGIATAFEVENELVGIGTDNPTNTLQALGNIKSSDAKVIGLTTLTTYSGFTDSKLNLYKSVGARQGTLSGEVNIEDNITVSTGTTYTSGVDNLTLTDNFTLPGISDDKPSVGTMRFNENFGTLEFYTGEEWRKVNSRVDAGNMGRAVHFGGITSSGSTAWKLIDYSIFATSGDAISFGDLTTTTRNNGSLGSEIRGFSAGGFNPSQLQNIDYIALASGGNCADFGDLSTNRAPYNGAASSSTRGIWAGGYGPGGTKDVIDYVEIMTTGNAVDFGDVANARFNHAGCSSPIRAVYCGGSASNGTYIDYVIIASKGNTTKFGNLTGNYGSAMACSNSVRGLVCGAYPSTSTTVDTINLSSEGNGHIFGDLVRNQAMGAATASQTKGLFAGGYSGSNGNLNTIQMINIQTQGDGADFGNLSLGRSKFDNTSDCHGGLGGF